MSVADEAEILTLLLSYARALDQRDWRAYAALYAPEGELVLPWGDPVPRAEIAADTEQKLGGFAATHHMSTNQQINVDGTRATSYSYVQATHVGHDGSLWVLGGCYENDYERIDGVWKFTRVRLKQVWESGQPPWAE